MWGKLARLADSPRFAGEAGARAKRVYLPRTNAAVVKLAPPQARKSFDNRKIYASEIAYGFRRRNLSFSCGLKRGKYTRPTPFKIKD